MSKNVGFIGLGVMGGPMARNLVKAGYQTVVLDVVPDLVNELVKWGATSATSPKEVAQRCQIVILSLPSTTVIHEVVLGENGLVSGLSEGSTVVDTSTVEPELSRELSAELLKKGCYYLDAPISGGSEGAEAATLAMMVGGDKEALARCERVLHSIAKFIFYVGESGSGEKVKLFNNALVSVYFAIYAEAFMWAESIGINLDDLLKVISKSASNTAIFQHFMSTVKSGNYEDGGRVRIIRKDLKLLLESARRSGVRMKLIELTSSIYEEAFRKGFDEKDSSSLLLMLREANKS